MRLTTRPRETLLSDPEALARITPADIERTRLARENGTAPEWNELLEVGLKFRCQAMAQEWLGLAELPSPTSQEEEMTTIRVAASGSSASMLPF